MLPLSPRAGGDCAAAGGAGRAKLKGADSASLEPSRALSGHLGYGPSRAISGKPRVSALVYLSCYKPRATSLGPLSALSRRISGNLGEPRVKRGRLAGIGGTAQVAAGVAERRAGGSRAGGGRSDGGAASAAAAAAAAADRGTQGRKVERWAGRWREGVWRLASRGARRLAFAGWWVRRSALRVF